MFGLMHEAPVGCRSSGAGVCCESNQNRLRVAFANELANIPFSIPAAIGSAGIAQVRIVGPDDDLGFPESLLQMSRERMERLRHVPISQIPGVHSTLEHPAIILLGILDQPGVLLGRKELVLGDHAVPMDVFVSAPL